MSVNYPKFVEQYQLTSSNFANLGDIIFDGYHPTFPVVSLGQEFSTTSNVKFLQVTSSGFSLGGQEISSYFPNNTTNLSSSGDLTVNGNLTVTGDLRIGKKVIGESFQTERTSSSNIFRFGSTAFGDSIDDKHEFTGSVGFSGGIRAVWDREYREIDWMLNGFDINGFASGSPSHLSSSLKRQDHVTKIEPIIPYAEANITLVQGDLSVEDILTRKNSYKSATSITENTASFNAVTASNVEGFTNVGKDDFLFFYNGFVIEPNCYDIQQAGATFLLKIDTSKFGYDLTTQTAGQTPKVAAWGKFNA